MFTMNFKRTAGAPAFSLSMPDASLVLQEVAKDEEKASAILGSFLRKINDGNGKGGIKLYDESGNIWNVEKTLSIIAQGMAVSNSSTWTAEDFANEWASGLNELTAALVPTEKIEAAKAILAQAVRHGGKGQLSEKQCQAIIRVYGAATNDSDVIAVAVANAKARKAEIEAQSEILVGL